MTTVSRVAAGAGAFVIMAGALLGVRGDAQQPASPPASAAPQEPAQPSSNEPAQPVFRTGINFVRVDVIVSDKQGNMLSDLAQRDFEVTEDGKPQTIETFKLVRLDGAKSPSAEPPKAIRTDYDEESEAARDDVRLFAVFLDDYHVRRGTSLAVREPLTRFIQTQLGASDMIGLMYPLQPVSQVRMTRNHDAVIKGVQQFFGRKFDYTPKNEFEEKYAYYPAEVVERIRNQVTLSAVKSLVTHMGSLKEGRKALILVSEGFTNILPPQLRDPIAAMPGIGNPQRGNPMAGVNDQYEQRAEFLASMDLETELRDVYDAANRNNTAIYTVDPRGLAPFEFDVNEGVGIQTDQTYLRAQTDTLRVLADQSDGRAIVNRNDVDGGMRQIVRDSSAYYLIGYNSTQVPSDGKFHEIRVRVKRSGVQVRARKGYWALNAEEAARATAPARPGPPSAVAAAIAAVEQPVRARVVRTWIGTSRGDNGKTKVTFVWEPVAKPLGEPGRPPEAPARVVLTAVGPDGAPYFRGRVPDAALGSAATSNGNGGGNGAGPHTSARVTFEVPPGTMRLRLSVEGTGAQVLDSETRDLSIPDLTSHAALGTPEVFRARNAREARQIGADPEAIPVATREFNRADRLLVRVPAYGPGSSQAIVTARLLNRAGQQMTELPVAAGTATSQAQVEVPLAGLAAGEYVLELKAAGEGGDIKEFVGFRVAG